MENAQIHTPVDALAISTTFQRLVEHFGDEDPDWTHELRFTSPLQLWNHEGYQVGHFTYQDDHWVFTFQYADESDKWRDHLLQKGLP